MALTTDTLVKELLAPGGDYDTTNNPSLTPFIDTAAALMAQAILCATRKGLTYTETERELLERWLAAHYYQQSDKGYSSKSTNGASASFQGQTGKGLESTLYGQTALTLDGTGCLASLNSRQRVRMKWLGKPPSEQVPYDQRD